MLKHILEQEEFSLALTPGFFRFYAHAGVLHAMEECNCLKVCHVTGSSAGALVGAFLASGLKPSEMLEPLFAMQRSDIWDMGGIGGLLKGEAAHNLLKKHLLVEKIEDCPIPFSVTAFDMFRLRTNCLTEGCIATATRASFTFPGLFQPVMIDGRPHIDGGVWDHAGLLAMEECFKSSKNRSRNSSEKLSTPSTKLTTSSTSQKIQSDNTTSTKVNDNSNGLENEKEDLPTNQLIVNVVFDTEKGSVLPPQLKHCRLLTIVMENIPNVSPFTMDTKGREAYSVSMLATKKALECGAHIQERAPNHWICYIDGSKVKKEDSDLCIKTNLTFPSPKATIETPTTNPLEEMTAVNDIQPILPTTAATDDQEVVFSRKSSATTDEFFFEEEIAVSVAPSASEHTDDADKNENMTDGLILQSTDMTVENTESGEVTQIQYLSFLNNGSFKFPNAMFDAMTSRSSKNRFFDEEESGQNNEETSSLKRKFDRVDGSAEESQDASGDNSNNSSGNNNSSSNKIAKCDEA